MSKTVNVVVTTYQRPQQLLLAVQSLHAAARPVERELEVKVVIVDDDPAGSARPVADEFRNQFSAGCYYAHCGQQNISAARNLGIELSLRTCDWIGSIDDDVQVPTGWFEHCLSALADPSFNAVTGSLVKDFSHGPAWLSREPFGQIAITEGKDGEPIPMCATGNYWVQTSFLEEHPELRFDLDFGTTGGEDVEFFTRAVKAGLSPVFASNANVVEVQPADRCTLRYQVRRSFWLGVTEAKVSRRLTLASRPRLLGRAAKRLVTLEGQSLNSSQRRNRGWRWSIAVFARTSGLVLGSIGLSIRHK